MARNFTEFQELILLAEAFRNDAVNGKRLGAVSGAGFEAVGMADSIPVGRIQHVARRLCRKHPQCHAILHQ